MSGTPPSVPDADLCPHDNWDVFVAYSSTDRAIAKRIADSLQPYLTVFIDCEQVMVGDHWDHAIRDALMSSRIILVIISPRTDKAFYERDELLRAIDRMRQEPEGVVVVPVFVDGMFPQSPFLPYGLRPLQGIEIKSDDEVAGLGPLLIQRAFDIRPRHFESLQYSPSIRGRLDQINQHVLDLTAEQYRVIQQLRYLRRVRISGSAGSGKTLVAAEKCARLSAAGQRVLFLCHNPLLAEYVRTLIPNSGVEVRDFGGWVAAHAESDLPVTQDPWTHYDEPTSERLAQFQRYIASPDHAYEAIVVDEAQDFRDEWWKVVEAALLDVQRSILYIFHDNNQSLLPYRGAYPIDQPQFDLSRNCRNAGRIYELMRNFDSSSPEPERKLSGLGRVSLTTFDAGQESEAASLLVRRHVRLGHGKSAAVLWSGTEPVSAAPVANMLIEVPACSPWQEEVRWQFNNASRFLNARGLSQPSQGYVWVESQLDGLSNALVPSRADIGLVRAIAGSYSVHHPVRSRIATTKPYKLGFHWTVVEKRLMLRRRAKGPQWAAEVILHFQEDTWSEGIPSPEYLRIVPFYLPQDGNSVPLFTVSDFKGLEADTVILLMRGRVPSHRNAVYVGISRARGILAIAADPAAAYDFPRTFQWDEGAAVGG